MGQVDMSILGNSSTESFYRLWLPDEGKTAADFFQEMRDRDAIIGGVFLAIESLFKQVSWQEVPANDTPEAQRWADFLGECRGDMSHTWAGFMGQTTSGLLVHGWGYFEKVYKLRLGSDQTDATRRSKYTDGLIGWRKFANRPQRTLARWEYDSDGGIQGMWQQTPKGEVFLPIQKSLHFTSNEEGPEGRSLLMNARQSYKYQERIAQFEALGIERDLAGMPLIEVPPELLEISPEDSEQDAQSKRATLRALEELGAAVRNDERSFVMMPSERVAYVQTDAEGNERAIDVPSGYKFSLISSGGSRAHDTDKIIKRYSQRIASSVLATFLLLGGSEGKGAQALSGDLTDLFLTVCTGLLDSMTAVVNRFGVQDLMKLNGVPPELWPTLEHGGLKKEDVTSAFASIKDLASEGLLTPDQPLEDYLRGRLGLPERADPKPAATNEQQQTGSQGQGQSGQDQQGQGSTDQQGTQGQQLEQQASAVAQINSEALAGRLTHMKGAQDD